MKYTILAMPTVLFGLPEKQRNVLSWLEQNLAGEYTVYYRTGFCHNNEYNLYDRIEVIQIDFENPVAENLFLLKHDDILYKGEIYF